MVEMNSLMSLFWFMTFALMVVTSGSIIGAIAKRKHRNIWLWKATGAFGFLVALISILCFRDLNSLSAEDQEHLGRSLPPQLVLNFRARRDGGGLLPGVGTHFAQGVLVCVTELEARDRQAPRNHAPAARR